MTRSWRRSTTSRMRNTRSVCSSCFPTARTTRAAVVRTADSGRRSGSDMLGSVRRLPLISRLEVAAVFLGSQARDGFTAEITGVKSGGVTAPLSISRTPAASRRVRSQCSRRHFHPAIRQTAGRSSSGACARSEAPGRGRRTSSVRPFDLDQLPELLDVLVVGAEVLGQLFVVGREREVRQADVHGLVSTFGSSIVN